MIVAMKESELELYSYTHSLTDYSRTCSEILRCTCQTCCPESVLESLDTIGAHGTNCARSTALGPIFHAPPVQCQTKKQQKKKNNTPDQWTTTHPPHTTPTTGTPTYHQMMNVRLCVVLASVTPTTFHQWSDISCVGSIAQTDFDSGATPVPGVQWKSSGTTRVRQCVGVRPGNKINPQRYCVQYIQHSRDTFQHAWKLRGQLHQRALHNTVSLCRGFTGRKTRQQVTRNGSGGG
jgi:hypothetical protein